MSPFLKNPNFNFVFFHLARPVFPSMKDAYAKAASHKVRALNDKITLLKKFLYEEHELARTMMAQCHTVELTGLYNVLYPSG